MTIKTKLAEKAGYSLWLVREGAGMAMEARIFREPLGRQPEATWRGTEEGKAIAWWNRWVRRVARI